MEPAEEDVRVKMSICSKCGGAVRVAIEHRMTEKDKKEFMKEVIEHNLDIKTVHLTEYKENRTKIGCFSNCPDKL
jgi:hypothetical protein